jgi:hypothetical protein
VTARGPGQVIRKIYSGLVGGKILVVCGDRDGREGRYESFPDLIRFRLVAPPLQSGVVGPYLVQGTWFPSHLPLEGTCRIQIFGRDRRPTLPRGTRPRHTFSSLRCATCWFAGCTLCGNCSTRMVFTIANRRAGCSTASICTWCDSSLRSFLGRLQSCFQWPYMPKFQQ